MARAMRRFQYRGKKQEYIKKDAIANILAKMTRWNITLADLERILNAINPQKKAR